MTNGKTVYNLKRGVRIKKRQNINMEEECYLNYRLLKRNVNRLIDAMKVNNPIV